MEEWFVGLLFGIGGTIVASGVTLLISTRDLGLKRRTDTIDRFLRTASVAHGYPVDERSGSVGTGEQIAAIFLVADLARRDKWLRLSGLAFLEELSTWLEHSEGDAATRLLFATRRRETWPFRGGRVARFGARWLVETPGFRRKMSWRNRPCPPRQRALMTSSATLRYFRTSATSGWATSWPWEPVTT